MAGMGGSNLKYAKVKTPAMSLGSAPKLNKPPKPPPAGPKPAAVPSKPGTSVTNLGGGHNLVSATLGAGALPKAPAAPKPLTPAKAAPKNDGFAFGFGKGTPWAAKLAKAPAAKAPAPRPATPASAPTVQAPGAPPGVPDTGFTIPLLPQDESDIQNAQQDYATAATGAQYGLGQSAFRYGDPTAMAAQGVGTINPDSDLAMAALRAQEQNQQLGNVMERNGTFFSSLNTEGQGKIAATQQRADLAGNVRYQQAMAKFNAAMISAQTTRDRAIGTARADERAAAIKNLPTANTASGGFPSSIATGSKAIGTKGGTGGSSPNNPKSVAKSNAKIPKTSKQPKPSGTGKAKGSEPKSKTTSIHAKTSTGGHAKVAFKKPPKVAGKKK